MKAANRDRWGGRPWRWLREIAHGPGFHLRARRYRPAREIGLVSVVVPSYNSKPWLSECLRSVTGQSYRQIECLVVDDGSTDGSAELAEAYAAGDERVKVLRLGRRCGAGAARNAGIAASGGKYIAFLDADDLLLRHSIWRRLDALTAVGSERCAGAFCEAVMTGPKANDIRVRLAGYRPAPRRVIDWGAAGAECPFHTSTVLLKRSVLERTGAFSTEMSNGEDWDLWQRLLHAGWFFVSCGGYGSVYRQHPGGLVLTRLAEHCREALALVNRAFSNWPAFSAIPADRLPAMHRLQRAKQFASFMTMALVVRDEAALEEIQRLLRPDDIRFMTDAAGQSCLRSTIRSAVRRSRLSGAFRQGVDNDLLERLWWGHLDVCPP